MAHFIQVGKTTTDFTPEKLTIKKSCMAREKGTWLERYKIPLDVNSAPCTAGGYVST